jgi:hypothetical protein
MESKTVTVDLSGGKIADAVVVDALARVALALGRHHQRLKVLNASVEFCALAHFMGLDHVLGVEMVGQTENGENSIGA